MTEENIASHRAPPKINEPHPVDIHVGQRMRTQRLALGFSQDRLAKELGLTFQQVQKYERGMNRVSASRLFELGKVLNVSIDFFFKGITQGSSRQGFAEEEQDNFSNDSILNRETIELIHSYNAIRDPKIKRQLLEMAKTLAIPNTNKAD